MADEPSRKKRTSERQLTKDDFSRDDDEQEEAEPQGTFAKASDDVMQKRKVVKARRPGASVVPAPAAVNPFAAVSLLSAGAGAGGTPPTPAPPAPEPEAPKTDKGESPAVAVAVEAAAGEEEEGEEVNKGDRKEPVGGASTSGQAPPEEAKKPPTTPGFGGFGKFAGSNAFGTGFGAGTGGGFGSAAGSTPSPFSFNFGTGAAGTSASFGSTPAFGAGASSFPSLSSVFGGTNGAPVQLFGGPGSSAASNDGEADEEGGGSSLPQPAPVVQLTEVKVETGEEKETAAFAADATLYEFAGGWKERGKGEVRVNVPADGAQRARLVMRARGNLRLLLNAHIYPGLKLSRMDGRGVSFAVVNHAGEAGGGMGTWAVRILPNLKIICCFGVGVDAIDLGKAKELGIPVTNTPGVLTEDTADTALALLLTTLRKACAADRFVRSKSWSKNDFPLATSLSVGGKKAGIVGLGDIGKAVAKRIEAFGSTICYQGPREKPEVPYKYFPTVEALAKEVDFLVLTCPGGAATFHIVNRPVLDALGPNGFVINVARGSVVDEKELVQALVEKRIAGAGLDVFESEPKVPEELLSMDNVVLFPHIGSATIETRSNMARLMMDNLRAHFDGKPLLTQVQ